MFQVLTPELMETTRIAVDNLKGPVATLNKKLTEFHTLVGTGYVRFGKKDFESMSDEYNKDFHEWVQNGAIDDFITKMATKYKHFDFDRYYAEGQEGDPNKYVRVKKRRVILGELGSIWIDLPLTGTVGENQVTKWTRAAFVYMDGLWRVLFDPTEDKCSFKQVEESQKFTKQMITAGVDVDIDA
jgi:hypothetical protein